MRMSPSYNHRHDEESLAFLEFLQDYLFYHPQPLHLYIFSLLYHDLMSFPDVLSLPQKCRVFLAHSVHYIIATFKRLLLGDLWCIIRRSARGVMKIAVGRLIVRWRRRRWWCRGNCRTRRFCLYWRKRWVTPSWYRPDRDQGIFDRCSGWTVVWSYRWCRQWAVWSVISLVLVIVPWLCNYLHCCLWLYVWKDALALC